MSVRDFINRGISIRDRSIDTAGAGIAIPEADPTLVTDGDGLPLLASGVSIYPPMLLVDIDFENGATPTGNFEFWGYITPPTTGPQLLSDWRRLETVTLSASQHMAIFPLLGLSRFAFILKTVTGAPDTARVRLYGISHHAADILIGLGFVAGSSNSVDLIKIAGTNVPSAGLDGVLPVGGTEADNAVVTASFSSRVAGIARNLLTAITAERKTTLLTDLLGRLWTHPDPGWEPYDGASQRVNIGAASVASTQLTVGAEYHIIATVACWIVCGGAAVAAVAGADYRLLPDVVFTYTCQTGKDYIAVIRETTDAALGLSICRVR